MGIVADRERWKNSVKVLTRARGTTRKGEGEKTIYCALYIARNVIFFHFLPGIFCHIKLIFILRSNFS